MKAIFASVCAAAILATALPANAAPAKAAPPAPISQAHPNFNGIWLLVDFTSVVLPQTGTPPFTAEAQANMDRYRKEFDPVQDDPARFCVALGMPYRMLTRARDYPVEIYQQPDRIFMRFEGHDDHRSIRLDRDTVPENLPQSSNGWSNARWDGQALVITTTNMTGRTDINPLPRSEEAVITERWTMRKDPVHGDVIDIDMTIVDPPIYKEPVKGRTSWKRAGPGVDIGGYNCADSLWDEYLEGREAEMANKAKPAK